MKKAGNDSDQTLYRAGQSPGKFLDIKNEGVRDEVDTVRSSTVYSSPAFLRVAPAVSLALHPIAVKSFSLFFYL